MIAIKKILPFLLLPLVVFFAFTQQPVPYGDNAAAGKYYTVRGVRLYTETYGKGAPLLLLHGNGGSIKAFAKNIPYFAAHYKVIAVDSRAQGKSVDRSDSLSFEMMADDMAALLGAMKLDSAYVIGWSDGGIVALLMAMRHPNKVKKLAATGANVTADSTAFAPGEWQQMMRRYNQYKDSVKAFDAKRKNDWKVFVLDVFQPTLSFAQLSTIKCPALIIAGDRDVIAPGHTLAIFQNIPRAKRWIIPNSGHATLIEHAAEFNEGVLKFFKESQRLRKPNGRVRE